MAICPLCETEQPDPPEPGTVECTNAQCKSSFVWPPVAPPPPADPQSVVDLVEAMSPEDRLQLLAELQQAAGDLAERPPRTTSLKDDAKTYVTDASCRRVQVVVMSPHTGSAVRARPTINGTPVAAGTYTYESPGHPLVVTTRSGINDLVVVEEW